MTRDKIDHLIHALGPRLDRSDENFRHHPPVVEHQGRKMRQGPLVFNRLAEDQVHFQRWLIPLGGAGKPIKQDFSHSCAEIIKAAEQLAHSAQPTPIPGALLHALRSIRLHIAP